MRSISRSRDAERIVDRRHEDAAHHVDDADLVAVLRARDQRPAAGHAVRIVRGPQQPRLDRDVVQHLFLVPDVIAGRHHVDAGLEDGVADFARHAEAARRIFRVGHDEVDLVAFDQRPQRPHDEVAADLAKDVTDEEKRHRISIGMSISRPRRSSMRGTKMRNSPLASLALIPAASKAMRSGTARTNAPNVRSATWKAAPWAHLPRLTLLPGDDQHAALDRHPHGPARARQVENHLDPLRPLDDIHRRHPPAGRFPPERHASLAESLTEILCPIRQFGARSHDAAHDLTFASPLPFRSSVLWRVSAAAF